MPYSFPGSQSFVDEGIRLASATVTSARSIERFEPLKKLVVLLSQAGNSPDPVSVVAEAKKHVACFKAALIAAEAMVRHVEEGLGLVEVPKQITVLSAEEAQLESSFHSEHPLEVFAKKAATRKPN